MDKLIECQSVKELKAALTDIPDSATIEVNVDCFTIKDSGAILIYCEESNILYIDPKLEAQNADL